MEKKGNLVLGRKYGERIVVYLPGGQKMTISVEPHKNNGVVKVCIDAPREIRVLRGELDDKEDGNERSL